MLLLKVILVVLISEIDCDPAPSVKENKNAPASLPQESLINNTDSNGCRYQLLPYFGGDDGMDFMDSGFLAVTCTKSCPGGIQENVVDGNPCVVECSYLDGVSESLTIRVLEGSCQDGSCNSGDPPKYRTITLGGGDSEEEAEE
uniref:Putative secreted protein n=1 Tax=Ixodes ricinus TaxID=34613 RepID=A0A090XB29_IXORI